MYVDGVYQQFCISILYKLLKTKNIYIYKVIVRRIHNKIISIGEMLNAKAQVKRV